MGKGFSFSRDLPFRLHFNFAIMPNGCRVWFGLLYYAHDEDTHAQFRRELVIHFFPNKFHKWIEFSI